MLQFSSLLMHFTVLLLTLALSVFVFFKWAFTYWKRKGFPYLKPTFPRGNFSGFSLAEQSKTAYDQARQRNLRCCGLYLAASPQLLVTDLDLLKNIMAKDFEHFSSRGLYYNEKDEPMGAHLFAVGGAKWRSLRAKSTPAFTSGKMKNLFRTVVDCLDPMLKFIDKRKEQSTDAKDLVERFTMDIFGSCAFGLDINTFEEPDSPFRKFGLQSFEMGLKRKIKLLFGYTFPELARRLHVTKQGKELNDFFTNTVTDVVGYRKRTGMLRKDFLQIFMDMIEDPATGWTMNEVVAQSYAFFTAGFGTSSSGLTYALYEIAKNYSIQDKLRQEINENLVKHEGNFTYEAINGMQYLSQVVQETLRKYPPPPVLTRECVKEYQVPGSGLTIPNGTKIVIPVYGIHMDPEYYPEPKKFDPDRFSDQNKRNRHPFAYLPFGEGPRICIGLKFGMMQSKVCLAGIIRNYKLSVGWKTSEPEKVNIDASILAPRSGAIWIDFEKLP